MAEASAAAGSAPVPDSRLPARRLPVLGRMIALGAVLAPVAVLVVQTPALAGALAALQHLDWRWLPLLLLAEVTSKTAVAAAQRHLVRRGTGARNALTLPAMLGITYAANTVSVAVPLAGAHLAGGYTFVQLRRRGITSATAGWVLLVSWAAATTSFATLVVLGAVITGRASVGALAAVTTALLLLAAAGGRRLLREPTARRRLQAVVTGAATGVLGAVLVLAGRGGRTRAATLYALQEHIRSVVEGPLTELAELRLPAARDRAVLMLLALLNWLADAACLAVAIAAVGAPVPWQGLLLAFTAAAGVTSLGLTPGGVGLVEVVLTGALVASGLEMHQALPAVVLYRLASF